MDLSGDGVLDLVSGSPSVDLYARDSGALFLWQGGASLTGVVEPSAVLCVSKASIGDRLGDVRSFEPSAPLVGDVSGDGRPDLLVGAGLADRKDFATHQRTEDAGAIYVWKGGAPYSGRVDPHAELFDPSARPLDRLAMHGYGLAAVLDDVSGDGVADVVALATKAEVSGFASDGKVLVWSGGSTLAGRPAPLAILHGAPDGRTNGLADVQGPRDVFTRDVTGDGVADLLVKAQRCDLGAMQAGALFLWQGGVELRGELEPGSIFQGALEAQAHFPHSVLLADVTGEGESDIVAGSSALYFDAADRIYLWAGGAPFGSAPSPSAVLSAPGVSDALFPSELVDLTGDGVLDVLASAPAASVEGVGSAGSLFLWPGGTAILGAPAPATLSRAHPHTQDHVAGVRLGDVSGDGRLDVLAGSPEMDTGATLDTGALLLWLGSMLSSAVETVELAVPRALQADRLGS